MWFFSKPKPKPECHVPRAWIFGTMVHEFNSTWCVPNKYKEPQDEERYRKII